MKEQNNKNKAYAILKNARTSVQKGTAVARELNGMSVIKAKEVLQLLNKRAAGIILKVLNSAVDNAVKDKGLDESRLKIKSIEIGRGNMKNLKRYRASAKGRALSYSRYRSHVKVVVGYGS